MRTASLLSLWVFTVAIAASVAAQDYFPLAEGWTWMYASTDGSSTDLVTISGMAPVIGGTAVVRHEVISGEDAQEFYNFWTRDGEGRTLLHGAFNPSGFLAYYDPPIVWYGVPPLFVGDEWCTEFLMYASLGDPSPDGPYVYCKTVSAAQTISVPAGVFSAIGTEDLPPPRAGYNVLGARVSGNLRTPTAWAADGVGEVRFSMGAREYELLGYTGPVNAVTTTWGDVKALFE